MKQPPPDVQEYGIRNGLPTFAAATWQTGYGEGYRDGFEAARALLREPSAFLDEAASRMYDMLKTDPRMRSMTSFAELDEDTKDIFRSRVVCALAAAADAMGEAETTKPAQDRSRAG